MKTRLLPSLLLVALSPFATAFGFHDIQYWVGSGSNRAGLVVQWDSGDRPQALAWGVRFDGPLTGTDLFEAVLTDPRLFAYTEGTGAATLTYGIGYDRDGLGVQGLGYQNPGSTPDDATALDAGDAWKAGWYSAGYWSLWHADGLSASNFAMANTGLGGLTIGDQTWLLWAFAPAANGWSTTPPTGIAAAPVPEPATVATLGLGLLVGRRRLRGSRV